jgi:hypothetical protein
VAFSTVSNSTNATSLLYWPGEKEMRLVRALETQWQEEIGLILMNRGNCETERIP